MKPLDQVEPRTPITSLPITIDTPGSYYLVGDLSTATDGITVLASDVTIDLMGFTITGPGPDSGTAVEIDDFNDENATVRNGTVRAFLDGVIADSVATNCENGIIVSEGVVHGSAATGGTNQNLTLLGDSLAFDTYGP